MSKKTIRIVFIFCIGIIAGIALYINFGAKPEKSSMSEDSLLVNNLYANPTIDNVNQDINYSRHNSILPPHSA